MDFLVQGTIYPDVIESGLGKSAVIKSHHNVGGLPGVVDFLHPDKVQLIGSLRPKNSLNLIPFIFPCPVAAMECSERKLYATQFHPEVMHTREGQKMLRAFVYEVCGCSGDWQMVMRRGLLIDTVRSPGEDNPLRIHFLKLVQCYRIRMHLTVHTALSDSPGNQLIVLPAKIQYNNHLSGGGGCEDYAGGEPFVYVDLSDWLQLPSG